MRHAMFNRKTVLVFASNSHYTTIFVEPSRRSMTYFDGLNQNSNNCPWEISLVKNLYEDESRRQGLQLHQDDWTICYPAKHMQRQQPYQDNTFPHNQLIHIDCGLYAILMAALYLLEIPLSLLTPIKVHSFRFYAGYQIQQNDPSLNISTFYAHNSLHTTTDLQSTTTLLNNQAIRSLPYQLTTTNLQTENIYDNCLDTLADKRHLRAKEPLPPLPQITIPEGAIQLQNDEASSRTYAAQSTLIGAGHGLYASITLDGSDDTKALVGEYIGKKRRSDKYKVDYQVEYNGVLRQLS